jgi:hypothetical protein
MTPLQRLPSRHRDPRCDAALVLAVSVSGRWWPQIVLQCVSPEVALLGVGEMSDLSPQSRPKQTFDRPEARGQRVLSLASASIHARSRFDEALLCLLSV